MYKDYATSSYIETQVVNHGIHQDVKSSVMLTDNQTNAKQDGFPPSHSVLKNLILDEQSTRLFPNVSLPSEVIWYSIHDTEQGNCCLGMPTPANGQALKFNLGIG